MGTRAPAPARRSIRRKGTHNRAGTVTVGHYVENYCRHLDHHLTFLKAKRERLGKPLPA